MAARHASANEALHAWWWCSCGFVAAGLVVTSCPVALPARLDVGGGPGRLTPLVGLVLQVFELNLEQFNVSFAGGKLSDVKGRGL